MMKLSSDMGGANLAADALNPSSERDTRQLPIPALCNTIPDRNADILHNIVNIARESDSPQVGDNIAMHSINSNHDLVDWDDTFRGWAEQGNVDRTTGA
jgi:hypothetical protein